MNRLLQALLEITRFLDLAVVPHMVIGGIANLTWGIPRATLDIDLTIQVGEEEIPQLLEALGRHFTLLPENPRQFVNDFERHAIGRARQVQVEGVSIRICAPEDLVVHKIISDRWKDLEDVKGIVARQGTGLDRAYLDPLVEELARELARPEILRYYRECWEGGDP